jgi:endonuclease-3
VGPRHRARAPAAFDIAKALRRLRRAAPGWGAPVQTIAQVERTDPFRILVGCILSLRTKDETTAPAEKRLFALADTALGLRDLDVREIERAIYPVGFYRTKATTLRALADDLVSRFDGRVPDTLDELLSLKGVGRKTANLVLSMAYGRPAICVDTHVHRIANRWGVVDTKTPDETEAALMRVLPRRSWAGLNVLLVAFGQTLCKPTSPLCSACPVAGPCPRIGVARSR